MVEMVVRWLPMGGRSDMQMRLGGGWIVYLLSQVAELGCEAVLGVFELSGRHFVSEERDGRRAEGEPRVGRGEGERGEVLLAARANK